MLPTIVCPAGAATAATEAAPAKSCAMPRWHAAVLGGEDDRTWHSDGQLAGRIVGHVGELSQAHGAGQPATARETRRQDPSDAFCHMVEWPSALPTAICSPSAATVA